jgi:FkbH-like protein
VKLAEALSIVHSPRGDRLDFPVLLACGFTPLHLKNYFAAHLETAMPDHKIRIVTGLFDDVAGALEQFPNSGLRACAVALEWADLDPRLGYRQLGGWGRSIEADVLSGVKAKLARLKAALVSIRAATPCAVSLPTLPLPPAFHTTGWQASEAELALEEAVARFGRDIGALPAVLLVNRQRLDTLSPPETRYDFRSDLHAGFPYTMRHADAVGASLAALIQSPQPKKGLITDLDDTLWSGLVGEAGHENVSWDLASHSQLHGLYQQMLQALADHGVLIAIASKNSPEVVEKALARSDLAIAREKIFPIEVHWDEKSASVARVLQAWNIGADSVVFVDDTPMELEEVRAALPGIECILFPKSDDAAGLALLRRLRDLFGKPRLSEEDAYRLKSIQQNRQFAETSGKPGSAEEFLSTINAVITLEFNPPASDRRVVELVNKTNQFNLNGVRYTDGEWEDALRQPQGFAIAVSYQDKFGPLGKIAVLRGRTEQDRIHVETWVMSCRAFSRRIEHQSIAQLFRRFEADEIVFDFQQTARNSVLKEFLSALLGHCPESESRLSREVFENRCPPLYHEVTERNA